MALCAPDALARQGHVDEKLDIPARPVVGVEAVSGGEGGAAEESRLLHDDDGAIGLAPQAETGGAEFARHAARAIHHVTIAGNHIPIRMGAKGIDSRAEGVGKKGVVGVEITENFTARHGEALVQPVGRAVVRVENDLVDAVAITLDDIAAAVGGPRIDDDILDLGIILVDHRAYRPFQERRLVEANGDDGNPGGNFRPGIHLAAGARPAIRRIPARAASFPTSCQYSTICRRNMAKTT